MPRRLALVVLLALFALTPQKSSAADWVRLRSSNFIFEGDVGEQKLRAVARRLEQFREVLARALPSARPVTSAPVTVLIFAHERDFRAVVPLFKGKPVKTSGYAYSNSFGPSISICLEAENEAYGVAYHEYANLLIANAMLDLPLWLEVGLGEFYGTFALSEDGRRAVLGRPLAPNEIDLLRSDLLPMSELLGATRDSRLYNVSTDRGLFYVQSWALVHYLLLGDPARARQFRDFIGRMAGGAPAGTAFTAAFQHADKLESELTAYIRGFSLKAAQVTFDDRVAGAIDYTMTPMTPAEAQASVGLFLVRQGRFEEARPYFEWGLVHAPQTASTQTGVGLSLAVQGKTLEALPALRKGVELADGDAMAHFALGYAVLQCMTADCVRESGGRETARRELQRAVDLLPQFPEALWLLSAAETVSGRDLASAERHILQAIAFLPGREAYRLQAAEVYIQMENEAKVQQMLGPIAASSPNAENKAKARAMLGALAGARAQREARKAELAAAVTPPAAGPPAAPGPTPTAAERPPDVVATPVFRVIGANERRQDGALESILCPAAGAVVVVRSPNGVHRYWAPALTAIDFITYRNDLKGSIGCGPAAAGTRVFVTFRNRAKGEGPAAAWIEGRAVALEFLPKGK